MGLTIPENLSLALDEEMILSKSPEDLLVVFNSLKKQLLSMYQNIADAINPQSQAAVLRVETAAYGDDFMGKGEINAWVDESGHKLMFRVKYSDGTLKSGEVALA